MEQITDYMKDKVVLVVGGTSVAGFNIVRFFLEKHATVIVPAKSLDEMNRLKVASAEYDTGTLITQLAELPDYETGFDIAETIVEKFGRIDIGVAVFMGPACNRQLTEVGINDWQNMVDNEMTPFFICARLILKTMKASRGGLYISVCDSGLLEKENASPLSQIAANAKMEMSRIFATETKKYQVRYYHLWIKNTDEAVVPEGGCKGMHVVSSDMIGNQIMKLYNNKTEDPEAVFQVCPQAAGL